MKRALALALLVAACGDGEVRTNELAEPAGDTSAPIPSGAGDAGTGLPPVEQPRKDAGPSPEGDDAAAPPPPARDAALPPPPPERDGGDPLPPERDAGDPPPPERDAAPPDPGLPPGDAPGNEGYIGASCAQDADCDFENAFCLGAAEGYPNGACSQDCDRFCPDREGASVTFCIADVVDGGACVQQCDYAAYPTGCRPGYGCVTRGRFGEADVERRVCLPGEGEPVPPGDNPCADELARRRLAYTDAENPRDHPDGAPDAVCDVEGALMLQSPVGGIDYRYVDAADARPMFMGCQLALAIDDLSAYLRELDVIEVVHIGTYNCRVIAGTDSLSMHGLGLALDIHELRTADGERYNVEDHWEDGDNPQTPRGRFLYEVAQQMFERGIFRIVLTPNYNAAHDNHFHVDLTPGGNFIGLGYDSPWGVYPSEHGD